MLILNHYKWYLKLKQGRWIKGETRDMHNIKSLIFFVIKYISSKKLYIMVKEGSFIMNFFMAKKWYFIMIIFMKNDIP